ncbi:MAG TPA: ribosome silencing factor [Clostridiaceae bacterium]|nr:ribosome silencing factor [Clostridiaceae bacterium]
MNIELLKDDIVAVLENKKAIDVEIIKVAEKTMLAEYFIIASGSSNTQVKSLVDDVLFEISEKHDIKPHQVEHDSGNRWNVLDYRDIIVHIFYHEDREFYQLEKLWHGPLSIDVVDQN